WACRPISTARRRLASRRTRFPSRSDETTIAGAIATVSNVSRSFIRSITTSEAARTKIALSGVSTSWSTTVLAAQESPATRPIESPTAVREWYSSERRWIRAKRSRATSYAVDCPTLIHRYVRMTSAALFAAKRTRLAPTTQSSSQWGELVAGSRSRGDGRPFRPRTLSTRIFIGQGVRRPRPVVARVTSTIVAQPRRYGRAYASSTRYRPRGCVEGAGAD